MNLFDGKKDKNFRNQVNVKLSDQDYLRLYKQHQKIGRSMPSILRESWLNQIPTKVLLNTQEGERLIKEMNRLGININQIARRVNAGVGYGWNKGIQECAESLNAMKLMCMAAYG
tara:strand:- start:490 stop:834 length:345 start_codon:yes stop_codon:yes gene_type:complete